MRVCETQLSTAPCQGSHTAMFKAVRYIKPPPSTRCTRRCVLAWCCSRFSKGRAAKKLGRTGPCDSLQREGRARREGAGGGKRGIAAAAAAACDSLGL